MSFFHFIQAAVVSATLAPAGAVQRLPRGMVIAEGAPPPAPPDPLPAAPPVLLPPVLVAPPEATPPLPVAPPLDAPPVDAPPVAVPPVPFTPPLPGAPPVLVAPPLAVAPPVAATPPVPFAPPLLDCAPPEPPLLLLGEQAASDPTSARIPGTRTARARRACEVTAGGIPSPE